MIVPGKLTIVVAESLSEEAVKRLEAVGDVRQLAACDPDTLLAAVPGCDALVVRSYARVTAQVLEAGDRLKVVGRAGAGLDNVDVAAARARGVVVVYTPAATTNAAAEHTVGLMLALERHLVACDRMVREGRFLEAREAFLSRELRGLVLGVVGMGRIGQAVARICRNGFAMHILYNDIRDVGPLDFDAMAVEKETLYAESDVVTLHVPLTDLTRGLIDAATLSRIKSSATLINTSRGAVVDAGALAQALGGGRLAGAAIDVHDPEPPPADYPLLDVRNCLLSPHVASRSAQGVTRMNDVVDDVIAVLRGAQPGHPAW